MILLYCTSCLIKNKKKKLKVHKGTDSFKFKNPIVAIGTFDGVHKGHYQVLNTLKKEAIKQNGESVIITFWPHPRSIVKSENKIELLNLIDEKIQLLEKTGIDNLIILEFSKQFSQLSAKEFVKTILVDKINIHTLIVGYDNQFGRNREGNISNLRGISCEYKFNIIEDNALQMSEINISSTKIRTEIKNKNIELANKYLGYNYCLVGKVVHGNKLGRKIGFPTANINVENKQKLIPANGVYAISTTINSVVYLGMANIGTKPTVQDNKIQSIEIHIFEIDDNINLYDKNLIIEFHKYFRSEQKMNSIEELKNQLKKDKIEIKQYFDKKY